MTRRQNVFGFDVTLAVEVPEMVTLDHPMQARLEHRVEKALKVACRQIAWHVIEWPKRSGVLRRMSFNDAEALGLLTEWRKAHNEETA